MALILHILTPLFLVLGFLCSGKDNATGSSDIRILNYEEFSRRFQDDTASLIRDNVIKIYRVGTRLYFYLSRLFYALSIVSYLAHTILLLTL